MPRTGLFGPGSSYGVDVAKEVHWAEIKVVGTGKVLASHPVDNTPQAIAALISEIGAAEAVHGPASVGTDILAGIASLRWHRRPEHTCRRKVCNPPDPDFWLAQVSTSRPTARWALAESTTQCHY